MKNELYSVFVGGVEVNDFFLTILEANKLAKKWLEKGYVDVANCKRAKAVNELNQIKGVK